MLRIRAKQFFILLFVFYCVGIQTINGQEHFKKLDINKIHLEEVNAVSIPAILDANHVVFHAIDHVNWTEYPYKPKVNFRMAYTSSAILIHFKVSEESIRAVADKDNGRVYEDSCVEFFVQPDPNQPAYYNLEFNCIGSLLMQGGPPDNRVLAMPEILSNVKRWSSLGTKSFEERIGNTSWELTAVIPFSTFFQHKIDKLDGKTFRANFYKCGEKQQKKHYLSWNPISLPSPQFHATSFFGYLNFN